MKIEGWEAILQNHIEDHRNIPFEWGKSDCVIFSADWVKKATGKDPMTHESGENYRERYKTEMGAYRLAKKVRGGLDGIFGYYLNQVNLSYAMRGDIVMRKGCCGICLGLNSFFKMEEGFVIYRTSDCDKAWRVD